MEAEDQETLAELREVLCKGETGPLAIIKLLCTPGPDAPDDYWPRLLDRMSMLLDLQVWGLDMVHCFEVINDKNPVTFSAWIDVQASLHALLQVMPNLSEDLKAATKDGRIRVDDIRDTVSKHFPTLDLDGLRVRTTLIVCVLRNDPRLNAYLDTAIGSEEVRWNFRSLWLFRDKPQKTTMRLAFVTLCGVKQLCDLQAFLLKLTVDE